MRVLVTGGRDGTNTACVERVLRPYYVDYAPDLILIEGGAQGFDRLVREWGYKNGVHVATVNALWRVHDYAAGPIRNSAMLILEPDVLEAFPGGKGTRDMISKARLAGIEVHENTCA